MIKNITVILWSMIFCQIVGFLGASLTDSVFNPKTTFIVSILFGLCVSLVPLIMKTDQGKSKTASDKK